MNGIFWLSVHFIDYGNVQNSRCEPCLIYWVIPSTIDAVFDHAACSHWRISESFMFCLLYFTSLVFGMREMRDMSFLYVFSSFGMNYTFSRQLGCLLQCISSYSDASGHDGLCLIPDRTSAPESLSCAETVFLLSALACDGIHHKSVSLAKPLIIFHAKCAHTYDSPLFPTSTFEHMPCPPIIFPLHFTSFDSRSQLNRAFINATLYNGPIAW